MKLSIHKSVATGSIAGVCLVLLVQLAHADDLPPEPSPDTIPETAVMPMQAANVSVVKVPVAPPSAGEIIPLRFGNPIPMMEQEGPTWIAPVAVAFPIALPEVPEPTRAEHVLQRQEDIESYQALLRDMEAEYGIWDITLYEELMALGDALQTQGRYEEALDVFQRAAHINRVNHGLNSVEQLAPLERLVETHLAMDNWKEADQQQYHAYYIQSRVYEPDDPRLIPALDKLARWNVMSFREDEHEGPLSRLLDAYWLYQAAASLVTRHFGDSDPRYVRYLEQMTETAYKMALYGGAQTEMDRETVRRVQERLLNQGVDVGPVGPVSGFEEGEKALRNIYELYSSPRMRTLPDIERRRVQALAELGDWYLMFNRRQNALRVYRDVYELLGELGPEAPDQFFRQVVALQGYQTSEPLLSLSGLDEDALYQGYIDITLDVSQYGRASNIQLAGLEPERATALASDVLRRTRQIHFRPRYEGGRQVEVQDVQLRFPFWYTVQGTRPAAPAPVPGQETVRTAEVDDVLP